MSRAERRHHASRKQEARKGLLQKWGCLNERNLGKARKSNFSCNCCMCQPHKNGFEYEFRPSERRKLQEEE